MFVQLMLVSCSRVCVFVVSMWACFFPYLSVNPSPSLCLSVNSRVRMLSTFFSGV